MKKCYYVLVICLPLLLSASATLMIAANRYETASCKKRTESYENSRLQTNRQLFLAAGPKRKKNPEIIKYLEAENAYTEAVMKPQQAFVENLYKEMLGRIKQTDMSVPYKLGDYWYFNKTEEGKQYPIYLRSQPKKRRRRRGNLSTRTKWRRVLNISRSAHFSVSDDGNMLAFFDRHDRLSSIHSADKDLRTGKILPDKIERVTSAEWANDNKIFFVVTEDDGHQTLR